MVGMVSIWMPKVSKGGPEVKVVGTLWHVEFMVSHCATHGVELDAQSMPKWGSEITDCRDAW